MEGEINVGDVKDGDNIGWRHYSRDNISGEIIDGELIFKLPPCLHNRTPPLRSMALCLTILSLTLTNTATLVLTTN